LSRASLAVLKWKIYENKVYIGFNQGGNIHDFYAPKKSKDHDFLI
jgi:hypothetical protein